MTEMKNFENTQFGNVRILEIDGEPWFVGKDVAECLGYAKPSNAIYEHVDEEDKRFEMLQVADPQNRDVPMGASKTAIINESGVYSLILQSKLPTARQFKRWITSEVLPSIRKTGAYLTEVTMEAMLNDPDKFINMMTAYRDERNKRLQAEQERKFAMEQKALAEQQRDEAIRTKYHFVEGRDAEMCGRVGGLTASNERLREQLGDATNWKQVKAIPWLRQYFNLTRSLYIALGKKLSALSVELNAEIREVEDTQYGHVKAYNIHVIDALRARLDRDPLMLAGYRLQVA